MFRKRGNRKLPKIYTKADEIGESRESKAIRLPEEVEGADYKVQKLDEPYLPPIWKPREIEYALGGGM